jgi:two-component system cell cycle sensor histidine kinase/response regulator CckA
MSAMRFTPEQKTHEFKMKHVLVVDDDPDVADSYKEMLQANDYLVTVAHNGVEGLKTVMHLDVDAIFCDMMMPHMAGDMFYLAVERVKPHLCPRFIFVTGYEGNPKFEAFFKRVNGVVLYKPVTLGKLVGTLSVMFSKVSKKPTPSTSATK